MKCFVIDVVCRDAVSGHEIRMMLALSLLDELICLEGRGAWLYYLSKQGRQFKNKIREIEIASHVVFIYFSLSIKDT